MITCSFVTVTVIVIDKGVNLAGKISKNRERKFVVVLATSFLFPVFTEVYDCTKGDYVIS